MRPVKRLATSLTTLALLATLASAQAHAQFVNQVANQVLAPMPGERSATQDTVQSQYDFSYQSSDPRVLVFDDGRDTRIQLPAGVIMPTIVGVQTQGEVLLTPEIQSPYILTRGVFQRVMLRWGNGLQVQVQYLGRTALAQRNGPAVAYGAVSPSQTYGVQAPPVLVTAAGRGTGQVVPVAYTQASPQIQPQGQHPVTRSVNDQFAEVFDFRPSDATMSGTLRRWAAAQGYELIWDLPPDLDPRITRTAALRPMTFAQALELVIKGMKSKGYAVGAHVYTDGVIHFREETPSVSDSNA